MASQADRSSAGETGPVARRPAAGRSRPSAGRSAHAPVPIQVSPASPAVDREVTDALIEAPLPPDILPRLLRTQAAYRLLITSGFTSQDAAGLIGYVVGLAPCESRWSLGQVNRMLFLRNLYTNTLWGEAETEPA